MTWNELKKDVFNDLLELLGRVFIVVGYAPDVVIGRRGFLPEEKERGIILVFNSSMDVAWHGDVLSARLVFGETPEDCLIPAERIVAIYNPDHNVQFIAAPESAGAGVPEETGEMTGERAPAEEADAPETPDASGPDASRVVEIDFSKRKARKGKDDKS